MTVSAVSFGNNVQTAPQTTAKKKMDPVKKGAIIGAGIDIGACGIGLLGVKAVAKSNGTTVAELLKSNYGSIGKYVGTAAIGIAIAAAIGAGIGKLVKNGQEKKAAKEAAADGAKQLDQQA